jgi:hypothetical protein
VRPSAPSTALRAVPLPRVAGAVRFVREPNPASAPAPRGRGTMRSVVEGAAESRIMRAPKKSVGAQNRTKGDFPNSFAPRLAVNCR